MPVMPPLEGIRIVELGSMITAPHAGMLLADLGADVIKVERPEGGDPFRSFRGSTYSPNFTVFNRNKRSIALNLQTPAGRELVVKLIAKADVLLENYRPGVMERLGLGANELAAANPNLIHATITGFGPDGPYSQRPAYDTVALAMSGAASLFADGKTNQILGATFPDIVTGIYAAYGILASVLRRERTGAGGRIELNMLEASIAFLPDLFANYLQTGVSPGRYTRISGSQAYSLCCSDGKFLVIHLSSREKFWRALVSVLGRTELALDPRFSTQAKRIENYEALRDVLLLDFATRDSAYWIPLLEQNDIPYAPIHSIPDVLNDPQVRHRGTFYDITHPDKGTFKAVHNPIIMDGARESTRFAPPVLGEHTFEVLKEIGCDESKFDALLAAGVIGTSAAGAEGKQPPAAPVGSGIPNAGTGTEKQ